MRLDPFKVARWMNARKYTVAQTAEAAGLDAGRLYEVLGGVSGLTRRKPTPSRRP